MTRALDELERLAPTEAVRWRQRLERTAHPCGCKSGAALSLLALVAWPLWRATSAQPHTLLAVGVAVVLYPVVVVAAGLVGKVAGIAVGRLRHRRARRQLTRRVSHLLPAAPA